MLRGHTGHSQVADGHLLPPFQLAEVTSSARLQPTRESFGNDKHSLLRQISDCRPVKMIVMIVSKEHSIRSAKHLGTQPGRGPPLQTLDWKRCAILRKHRIDQH